MTNRQSVVPESLPPEELRAIGECLFGAEWQAKLCEALGRGGKPLNDRTMRRWLAGDDPVPPDVAGTLALMLKIRRQQADGRERTAQLAAVERTMVNRLWRLDPVDLAHPDWEASIHRGPAVVRAPDERSARWVATFAFVIATSRRPGEDTRINPWRQPERVTATAVDDPSIPLIAAAAVIDPPHHDD